jgi:hypothetical protein
MLKQMYIMIKSLLGTNKMALITQYTFSVTFMNIYRTKNAYVWHMAEPV